MPDEWQIEAVKEQFKVLHSLETLQTDLDTNDVRAVTNEVDKIVRKHLRVTDNNSCKPSRNICAEIIKVTDGRVKFGFIVIVSDQRVQCQFNQGQLIKIPIFVIQFGSDTVFIDMSCMSFKSWDSILQHSRKVLPPGKFCFPVNGRYLDDKRLMIDFATNQVYPTRLRGFLIKLGIGLSAFAASFFFNIKPAVFLGTKLLPLAEQYCDSFDHKFVQIFMPLIRNFLDWKEGKISWQTLAHSTFESLYKLHQEYKGEIYCMIEQIKCAFGKIWDYLKNRFSSFFHQKSFPFKLLALASTNDEPLLRNGDMSDLLRQRDVGASQIFGNCINESALNYQIEKQKSRDELQDLTPCNKALVDMTYDFITHSASDQQDLAQNELSYIYQGLKELVLHESNERLKSYYKHREAACKFSDIINIDEYNKCLGITGDPETHCFMEAVGHINQSPIIKSLVNKKSKQLIEQEPVHLIQCLALPSNQKCGLYKCIGMKKGLIPAQQFVNSLEQIFCSDEDDDLFDEYNLVEKEEVKELSSEIVLMTNNLCIFIWQGLNKEKCAEGFLVILEEN